MPWNSGEASGEAVRSKRNLCVHGWQGHTTKMKTASQPDSPLSGASAKSKWKSHNQFSFTCAGFKFGPVFWGWGVGVLGEKTKSYTYFTAALEWKTVARRGETSLGVRRCTRSGLCCGGEVAIPSAGNSMSSRFPLPASARPTARNRRASETNMIRELEEIHDNKKTQDLKVPSKAETFRTTCWLKLKRSGDYSLPANKSTSVSKQPLIPENAQRRQVLLQFSVVGEERTCFCAEIFWSKVHFRYIGLNVLSVWPNQNTYPLILIQNVTCSESSKIEAVLSSWFGSNRHSPVSECTSARGVLLNSSSCKTHK